MILGYGVCGPNEKYLDVALAEFARLCDKVVITGNNIDPNSKRKIRSYGFELREDDREWGKYQPKIKEDLVRYASRYNPDWFMALDMDERFDRFLTREKLQEIFDRGHDAYATTLINLWDDGYNPRWTFDKVQIWRNTGDYSFLGKSLHCGLVPKAHALNFAYTEHMVIHHGLKDKADRERKAKRYDKYDPKAQFKGKEYYDALRKDGHAVPFDEKKLYNTFKSEVEKLTQPIKTPMSNKVKKFWYVRRVADGVILDIPDADLEETLKRGFELVSKEPIIVEGDSVQTTKIETASEEDNICDECGFVAKNAFGLRAHAKEHNKEEVENKCGECGFVAKSPAGLKTHSRKHDRDNNS